MILLREYGLLFLKTVKTAGTSLEIALSASADSADIVTPISPVDELVRIKEGYQLPVNSGVSQDAERRYIHYVEENRDRLTYEDTYPHGPLEFYNHIDRISASERLDSEELSKTKTVALVRHPSL